MYYICLNCKQKFNANFTPSKDRACNVCQYPCVSLGKRIESVFSAITTLKYYIKYRGEIIVWDLIENAVTDPIDRIYLRGLFNSALKRKNKKKK